MPADFVTRMGYFDRIIRSGQFNAAELAIAWVLAFQFYNSDTGRCDPGRTALATRAGDLNHATVKRALRRLTAAGWLTASPGQGSQTPRGATTAYALNFAQGVNSHRVLVGTGCQLAQGVTLSIEGVSTDPPEHSKEHSKRGAATPLPFPAMGGKTAGAVKRLSRDKRLYLAKHGCAIDSYSPDPVAMAAWAAEHAPLIANPVAPDTVDEIKDVWRQRGEKPKDFDATYRTYLRKRNEWAAERGGAASNGSASLNRRRVAAI